MAAGYDGSIRIDTRMDAGGFNTGRRQIESGIGGIKKSLGGMAAAVGVAFGFAALVKFGKECVDVASNTSEVQNVVDTAFGSMAYKIEEFAKSSVQNFGMSKLSAKKTASTYMAMARGMGIAEGQASDMAISLTGLTGDVASFYNISQELADVKLKSVFTGETETLKDLGIVMTQTNLQAFAMSQGIQKNIADMTQAEMVALRYKFVTQQLSLASGDFAKTQGSWANQTRILSEQFKELMGIIGGGIVTALTPAIQFINAVIARLIAFAQTAATVVSSLYGKSSQKQGDANKTYQGTSDALESSKDEANGLADATAKTSKEAKNALATFDDINKIGNPESNAVNSEVPNIDIPAIDPIPMDETQKQLEELDSKLRSFLTEWAAAAKPTEEAFGRLATALEPLKTFAAVGVQDFYQNCLKPIGTWVLGEGLPRFVDALRSGIGSIDFTRINAALNNLWTALTPFAIHVGEGLLWFWENVLVPLGVWVANEVVPRFLDMLAAAIGALNVVIEILKPYAQWIFDNFLYPLAQWTGGVIVDVIESITRALIAFSDWARENPEAIKRIADVVMALLAGIVTYCVANKVISWIESIGKSFVAFGTALSSPAGKIALLAVGIVLLVGLLMQLGQAWENMTGAEKVATAIWVAVVAVAALAVALGAVTGAAGAVMAAVAIIAGIGMITANINAANARSQSTTTASGKSFGASSEAGRSFSPQIPRLATGAVIPPNNEFVAMLGDQTSGTNIETPLSTMVQAFNSALDARGGGSGTVDVVLHLKYDNSFIRGLNLELDADSRRRGVKLVRA